MTSAFTFYFPSILPLRIYSETEKKMINDFILSRTKIQKNETEKTQKNETEKTPKNETEKTQKTKDKIYIELRINKYKIGKLIGKQGINIEKIRQECNANIRIAKEEFNNKRSIFINGSKKDVNYAKQRINKCLED